MRGLLDEILGRVDSLPRDQQMLIEQAALEATKHLQWVPNPGPQYDAYFCEADELFYGGQAGPGKTDLILGLAANCHRRSLILREFNEDARSASDRFLDIVGTRQGFNGQILRYVDKNRLVEFGGCKDEKDKQRYKGDPHDFIGFDEIGDFTESQFEFIITWNRSADENQRCRVVCTGNPPTRAKGLWVIKRWAAWLDPRHANTARPGELRWYTTDEDGGEIEVDGPGPHTIGGRSVVARSRTFIRGELKDNPDLVRTNYDANLSALPKELRDAYRDGKFDASLKDHPFQLIPTEWVREAQERWTDRPPGVPLCAMGLDVAQGGADDNILAMRHDGWFAPLVKVPGSETPVGTDMAGVVVTHRRDDAIVIVDCGGGYGGAVFSHLKENDILVKAYKGAETSTVRTADRQLGFFNKRAEAYWRFREALDPNQAFGSPVALPPDPKILGDLTAPTFEVVRAGIKVEPKEKLCDRLGYSTNEGDAIVMAWSEGQKGINQTTLWSSEEMGNRKRRPRVIMGRRSARAAARR